MRSWPLPQRAYNPASLPSPHPFGHTFPFLSVGGRLDQQGYCYMYGTMECSIMCVSIFPTEHNYAYIMQQHIRGCGRNWVSSPQYRGAIAIPSYLIRVPDSTWPRLACQIRVPDSCHMKGQQQLTVASVLLACLWSYSSNWVFLPL